MMRKFAQAAAVFSAAGTLMLAAAMPANAAVVRVFEGSDYASVGDDKVWVEACDMENDGNGVYGKFQIYGSATWYKVGDSNGSQGGCGSRTFANRVIVFYVCEDDIGEDTCRGKFVN
ncbi:hypothetical protein [Streptomyces chilikensis]|uniref:hypothetical protein n=1 Tax=Streptomyces chilikensis TaxID=1194079 RepID=UPI001407D4AD|nr:hypothetical protein [Streptomyces chilikensis]